MNTIKLPILFVLLLMALLLSPQTYAAWTVSVNQKAAIKQKDIDYRFVSFTDIKTKQTFHVNVVVLSKNNYRAKLVDQPDSRKYFSVAAVTKANQGFLGINGGFYTPEFQPLGLLVADGKKLSPLLNNRLLMGLVVIDSQGHLQLKWRGQSYKNAQFAFQSGPYIIKPGGRRGIKKTSTQAKTRTVLAQSGDKLLVMSTSAVSLYDLAAVLSRYPNAFGVNSIERALNLDGGRSTAMILRLPEKNLSIFALAPVRSVLVFY